MNTQKKQIHNSKYEINFELEKRIIIEQAKREENERFLDYLEIYREAVKETTYTKGSTKVKNIYLPFPTHDRVLKNKERSMKAYATLLLESNYGGKVRNMSDRYIYANKLDEKLEEMANEISTSSKKISTRTLKKYIKALSRCDVNILEPMANYQGELFYKLNYSVDEKYFTLIHDIALRKLINSYSENTLRTYLVILYNCFDYLDKEKNSEPIYKETEISQSYICEKIGLKTSSRKLVTDCIESLAKGGFIKVRFEYKVGYERKDGKIINYPIPKCHYSISKDYLNKLTFNKVFCKENKIT